jgi:hypothetical protein
MKLWAEARGVTIWRASARTNRGAIVAAAVLRLGTTDAQAQDDTWFAWDAATGSWGGARQRLVEAGVTPRAIYTTDLLANPIGGASQGFAYAGNLEASLGFDLERLLGIQGMAPVTERPRALPLRSRTREADQVLVAVQDSGIGIDREPEPAVRHFRHHQARRRGHGTVDLPFDHRSGRGSGVGFSQCRRGSHLNSRCP